MSLMLDNVSRVVGGETHIAPVDLELESGSLSLLLGLTLSGKTSLMRLMAGLDKPTTGRILVDGKDVTGRAVRKRNVAMVYQQFINYPSLTVYENIASPLRIAGMSSAEIDRRVRAEAERLRIEAMLDRLPAELSGGQQQRTAMARALVRDAELVLLDEPLVNLDYKLRETLREELPRALEGRRSMVVYATTDPWEALSFGGRTAVLEQGRLLQYDYAAAVYAAPATTHVASVFSDPPMNIVAGELTAEELRLGDLLRAGRPPALANLDAGDYLFGIRPAHLAVNEERVDHSFRAEVDVTEISGSDTYVHCRVADRAWVAVQPGVHAHELGAPIQLGFDIEKLFVFERNGRLVHSPEADGPPRRRDH